MSDNDIVNNLNLFLESIDFNILEKDILILNDFKIERFICFSKINNLKCEFFVSSSQKFIKIIIIKEGEEFRGTIFGKKYIDLFLSFYENNKISEDILGLLIKRYEESFVNQEVKELEIIKKIILKQDSSKTYLFNLL